MIQRLHGQVHQCTVLSLHLISQPYPFPLTLWQWKKLLGFALFDYLKGGWFPILTAMTSLHPV